MMHMLAAFNEFERGIIKERTKLGLARPRRKVALLETFVPGFMYLPLFLLGWAGAYNVLKQLKTTWIRWTLYVLTLIAFFLATMWSWTNTAIAFSGISCHDWCSQAGFKRLKPTIRRDSLVDGYRRAPKDSRRG